MITQSIHPVVAWAHNVVEDGNFAILDTETTDLNGQIVDLAIISATGETLFNSLIQPFGSERITEGARAVHGISDDMLLDAPTLALVWPQIFDILAPMKRILCYNASFDSARLVHSCKANGLPGVSSNPGQMTRFLLPPWSCLMKQYALYYDDSSGWSTKPKWQSLSNACKQQRIAHTNWHHALGDCQATLKLLNHLAALYPVEAEQSEVQF